MSNDTPLVWLCGPPGVGKTAVAWAVSTRLVRAGIRAAFVDVDQLGMCYPERRDDPDRHVLKARNVRALRDNFAAAGADCVIVSGVVDPQRGPEAEVNGGPVVVGRLRVNADQLLARLRVRTGPFADPDAAVQEAHVLDLSRFADWCLDTTALSIDEAADQVLSADAWSLRQEDRSLGTDREHSADKVW